MRFSIHTVLLSVLLASCQAGSIIVDRLCTDGQCASNVVDKRKDEATPETPLQGFSILGSGYTGSGEPILVKWEPYAGASSYEVTTALDQSCQQTQFSQTVKGKNALVISGHASGAYFLCVSASSQEGNIPALNNGIPFTIKAEPGTLLWQLTTPYNHTTDSNFFPWRIAPADASHVYVLFYGDNYFRPGLGYFIYKFDSSGQRDETFEIEISDCHEIRDLEVGPSGNLYVGCIADQLRSSRVVKFSSTGDLLWTKEVYFSNNLIFENHMALDASENIYVTNNFSVVGADSNFIFLTKLSSDGTEDSVNWHKTINLKVAFTTENVNDMVVDSAGDVVITGWVSNLVTGSSGVDIFIKKFSSAGVEDTVNWNKKIHVSSSDFPQKLLADGTDIYLAGSMVDRVSASSEKDGVILKFNASGVEDSVNWGKVFHSGNNDLVSSLVVDSAHNLYAVIHNLINDSAQIKKYDASGNELVAGWNKTVSTLDYRHETSFIGSKLFTFGMGSNLASATSALDGFINVYDSAGNEDLFNWHKIYDKREPADVIPKVFSLSSNGNSYVIGETTDLNGAATGKRGFAAVVKPDGSLDQSKSFSFPETENIRSSAADSTGNLFIASVRHATSLVLIRKFLPNGSEDLSWNIATTLVNINDNIDKMITDAEGSLYVCATLANVDSPTSGLDLIIRKYLSDASLAWQYTFPSTGSQSELCRSISLINGYVYALGRIANNQNTTVMRFNPTTGAKDNTWEVASFNDSGNYQHMGVAPSGYVTLFGEKYNAISGSNSYDWAIRGFSADGQADPQLEVYFDLAGTYDTINGISRAPNGDYIIAGSSRVLGIYSTEENAIIKRMTSTGIFLPHWERTIDISGNYDAAIGTAVTSSGDVLVLSDVTVSKSGYNPRREFLLQKYAGEE